MPCTSRMAGIIVSQVYGNNPKYNEKAPHWLRDFWNENHRTRTPVPAFGAGVTRIRRIFTDLLRFLKSARIRKNSRYPRAFLSHPGSFGLLENTPEDLVHDYQGN